MNSGQGIELTFLMGADVAASLESWRRPERVLELARVAVAARPGTELDEAEAALERLGAEAGGRADAGAGGVLDPDPAADRARPARSATWCRTRSSS